MWFFRCEANHGVGRQLSCAGCFWAYCFLLCQQYFDFLQIVWVWKEFLSREFLQAFTFSVKGNMFRVLDIFKKHVIRAQPSTYSLSNPDIDLSKNRAGFLPQYQVSNDGSRLWQRLAEQGKLDTLHETSSTTCNHSVLHQWPHNVWVSNAQGFFTILLMRGTQIRIIVSHSGVQRCHWVLYISHVTFMWGGSVDSHSCSNA